MHDTDLESRLSTAVDDLRPSSELGDRITTRVAQYDRHRRLARASVSGVAGLVVIALIGTLVALNRGRGDHVVANQPSTSFTWSTLPAPPIGNRQSAVAVWTGTEAVFWGGEIPDPGTSTCTGRGKTRKCTTEHRVTIGPGGTISHPVLGDGAAYDPGKGSWRVLPEAPIGPRSAAAAVWTGAEMIVWGGWRPSATTTGPGGWSDGGAYNPATNRWRAIPEAPINRIDADAIWTGREMIVLGGSATGGPGGNQALGAAFDPVKNTWRTISDPAADVPTSGHAVWTGDEVLYWLPSGDRVETTLTTPPALFAYNPSTDQWRRLASPAPQFHLVWNQTIAGFGDGRLIVAGTVPEGKLWDAEAIGYDLATNSWAKVFRGKNTRGQLVGVGGLGTFWTGGHFLVTNAFDASNLEPAAGTWRLVAAPPFGLDRGAAAATDDGRVYIWTINGAAALSAA